MKPYCKILPKVKILKKTFYYPYHNFRTFVFINAYLQHYSNYSFHEQILICQLAKQSDFVYHVNHS